MKIYQLCTFRCYFNNQHTYSIMPHFSKSNILYLYLVFRNVNFWLKKSRVQSPISQTILFGCSLTHWAKFFGMMYYYLININLVKFYIRKTFTQFLHIWPQKLTCKTCSKIKTNPNQSALSKLMSPHHKEYDILLLEIFTKKL